MTTKSIPASDILCAATLHLEVLESFIGVARDRMAATTNAFARDSLNDLLGNLVEQREAYLAFAARPATQLTDAAA